MILGYCEDLKDYIMVYLVLLLKHLSSLRLCGRFVQDSEYCCGSVVAYCDPDLMEARRRSMLWHLTPTYIDGKMYRHGHPSFKTPLLVPSLPSSRPRFRWE